MTPEAKVKRKVTEQLRSIGAYYFFPATGGYGKSGVPDIVGCYNGKFFGIECKAGKNTPTALQQKNLDDIASVGGSAVVINEQNVKEVLFLIGAKPNSSKQLDLEF
jgi:Holliday junction resolvase